MRFEDQRQLLVSELRSDGITDEAVLKAFGSVAREHYVLPEYQIYAYRNKPLPILDKQTISQPLMIALMLQYLEIRAEDIVLEIGTGSGYEAALLASITKEVCTIERIESLSLSAQRVLREDGFRNIYFRIGDGTSGWQKAYPPYKEFSRIIVSAGADMIPEKLTAQLAEGGIMVIPVGPGTTQSLLKITRQNGELLYSEHGACAFVPLIRTDT